MTNFNFPLLKFNYLIFSTLAFLFFLFSCSRQPPRVLVFSKTTGFRHESIEAGKVALLAMGKKYHFQVDTTENDSAFYEVNLKKYHAVVFLNTTGDVLNPEEQNNFERFIQAGGGYVGIHSATDTEYGWPWYGKLAGAYFESHPNNPNVKEGEYYVTDHNHAACDSLPERFKRTDEFYNFKQISPDIKVLVKIDEKTYTGGTNGDNHPVSWYQGYDGGRAFYTAMGHTIESFTEPLFLNHLWGGIQWVLNGGKPKALDYSAVRTKRMPEENRFSKVILDEKLNEPIELAILPSGNVLFVERHGAIKIYDQNEKKTMVVDSIAVSHEYTDADGKKSEAEDGLLGVQLDPHFEKNNFIYFYYSPAGNPPVNALVRYELKDEKLVRESKKVMLEVPVQREQCCHTGGSIAFDAQGNLFVSTGDNTSPRDFAYGPNDERPGRSPWDAQKSSGNTNDLRGKVLRIHPEPDGSYTIPEGNLFPKGTQKTRPETYVMGTRNPYRISVDKKTGYLYWGEVGPDANNDSIPYGSRGYDEVNQAKKAGYFGWPYFVGNNQPYVEYDFAAKKSGEKYDPAKPVNDSPNNTGLAELPPVSPPFIWYPYAESTDFPLVGSGGRNAMAGPVFYSEDFKNAKRPFPDYYDGKLLIYDWMRGWIMAVTLDSAGGYASMEPFMGSYKFSNPIDMEFSRDGDLYMLEYGTGWFQGNDDARLVRIEYTAGNRKPQVKTTADKTQAAVPFAAHFTSKGTVDCDKDALKFKWDVKSPEGKSLQTFTTPDMDFSFEKPGIYKVELTVADGKGGESVSTTEVQAGNEPPQLEFAITRGNTGFFFSGQSFDYQVKVSDKEDGDTESGSISAAAVSVSIDYLAEGFDKAMIAQGHQFADDFSAFSLGKSLMGKSDCKSCHALDKKSIGPAFADISKKYATDPKAPQYLAKKIKEGGAGVWGEVMMAAHPSLPDKDVAEMVKYILGITAKPANSLPLKGSYTTTIPKGQSDQGVFILRVAYTDKGANGIPGIRSEQVMMLRNASLSAAAADLNGDMMIMKIPGQEVKIAIAQKVGAYIAYKDVDMSGIGSVMVLANAPANYGMVGGSVEVRLDSPTGELIGTTSAIEAKPMDPTAPPMPAMAVAPLKPQTGKQDVYFVVKNDKAPTGAGLMVLMQVMFQGAGKPPM
ncbi:MAG: ThuA domain-containing protein [Bacteroidetes bacterium]|nr:ThuA domain-containing protein [Bacteroidota bacterium]